MLWSSCIKPQQKTVPTQEIDAGSDTKRLEARFHALPPAVAAFTLGSAAALSSVLVYKRYERRIRNSVHLPYAIPAIWRVEWLKDMPQSVGDADNFRFFHTPTLGGYFWPLKFRRIPALSKDLKDETLHIRIAGVDAPELGHVQLLRTDHYSRIISQVYLIPHVLPGFLFYGGNLPAEMLRTGWAVTYEQTGAEYGRLGKDGHRRLEAQVRAARRGMWRRGVIAETPAEYKRRHTLATTLEEAEAAKPTIKKKVD